jgi:hypothetical protein
VSLPILGSAIAGGGRAYPSIRGSVQASTQASGGSFVPTIPTHSAGNIILVFVAYKGPGSGVASGFPAVAVTASAGWTEKAQTQNTDDTNTKNGGIALFSRTATTSSHSITITNTNGNEIVVNVYVIQGGSSVEAAAAVTGSDPPSLSPSWGTDFTYWLAANENGGGFAPGVVPTGFSNTVQTTQGNSVLTTCDKNEVTATQDPSAFTGAADRSCSITAAVRP